MLLRVVGLLCVCAVTVNAAGVGNGPVPNGTEAEVSRILAPAEAGLTQLLGAEVEPLDKVLKTMIEEMAKVYGVPEKQMALIAKEVMQMVSRMSPEDLAYIIEQVSGLLAHLTGPDAAVLRQASGNLGGAGGMPDEDI